MSGPTFEIFTLFPEAIAGFLRGGLVGRAVEEGRVAVHCTDFRSFATDRHHTVDDTPFGGGPGMVIKPEPVVAALEAVTAARGPMHRILLTPSAPRFDQRVARRLVAQPRIALLCGRYEGIDDRVREAHVDECLSLGDFVLNGGEIAALAILESVARLCEGVLGNPESAAQDSFADDDHAWLECPQYTRPPTFRGRTIPAVLLGGNHPEIARWRAQQAWARTWAIRPDLRPCHRLPETTPIYLVTPTSADELRLTILAGDADPPHHSFHDLKGVRRHLRRRHGHEPHIVGITSTPAPTSLPVATSAPALLDLLDLWGDLSAPLVLMPRPLHTPAPAGGDLTQPAQGREDWPTGVVAVLAMSASPPTGAAFQLAGSSLMSDSSPPQASHDLAVAALMQLRQPPHRP